MATNAQGARSTPKPKAVPLDAALADDAWGWDSMASSCCSGNRARFVSLRKCAAVPVKVADGGVVHASHIGSVALRVVTDSGKVVRIVVDNVLYHERFSSNLLSSELLTKKLGWQHHSTPEEIVRRDARRAPRDAQHARQSGGADERRTGARDACPQRGPPGRSATRTRTRWCACTRRWPIAAGRA